MTTGSVVDKIVGGRIKARRAEIGFNLASLANRLRVSVGQLELWEAGSSRVPPSVLANLARTLETNPTYFFPTEGQIAETRLLATGLDEKAKAEDMVQLRTQDLSNVIPFVRM